MPRDYIDPTAGLDMNFTEAVRIVESSLEDTMSETDALQLTKAQAILATEYVQIRHRIAPS